MRLIEKLKEKTGLKENHIENILKLLEEGSTIPFIARYRKELTGSSTDKELRDFYEIYIYQKELLEKKEDIKRLIKERSNLTPKLEREIDLADTKTKLDDIFRPFKEKKNTRAKKAIDLGLEPLANLLERLDKNSFESKAKEFVNDKVTLKNAIDGAKDIVAERYSDDAKEREILKKYILNRASIETKATKKFQENGAFRLYKEHSEKLKYIPSHRFLAIKRAESEKEISLKLNYNIDNIKSDIEHFWVKNIQNEHLKLAYFDGLSRLLLPSIEREIISNIKENSDKKAINLFGENLKALLLTPPVKNRTILGFDPAYRTGCKLAIIDSNAKYLDSLIIYPTPPQSKIEEAEQKLLKFIEKYSIDIIAIGNGTASKESEKFVADFIQKYSLRTSFAIVSEAGASVYSASKLASSEYPDLDVTIKGAISIASRVQDPMATFVKIDPKSLGIGQYQHDVNQKELNQKLNNTTEDVVNSIGVDINTSSYKLLSFVAGISEKLAKNIVEDRDKNGKFETKIDLKRVKGLGAKAFEQCGGFIKVLDSKNILDSSAIHPESFHIAKYILENFEIEKIDIRDEEILTKIEQNSFTKKDRKLKGKTTIIDIINDLKKPNFDIRDKLTKPIFRQDILDIKDLKLNDRLSGVIRSVVDFGAFIDVGLKNDGFIHISEISETRIKHPLERLSVNEQLTNLKVIKIDLERGKVSLSLKS